MKKPIPITELAKRLMDATKSDLYVDIDIEDGKYKIPLETAIALGLVLTDSDIFKRRSTPADIKITRRIKALSAGSNNDITSFSLHAIELYWIAVWNPDAAARAITATIRDPLDAILVVLSQKDTTNQIFTNFTTDAGAYLFLPFPGGLKMDYDCDLKIDWVGMTGSNSSFWSVAHKELNDQ